MVHSQDKMLTKILEKKLKFSLYEAKLFNALFAHLTFQIHPTLQVTLTAALSILKVELRIRILIHSILKST